jgi:putative membrane protein
VTGHFGYGFFGGWWIMGIFWILILILAGVLLYRLARNPGGVRQGRSDDPETILKRRYANGEIEKEEFERKLSDLRR